MCKYTDMVVSLNVSSKKPRWVEVLYWEICVEAVKKRQYTKCHLVCSCLEKQTVIAWYRQHFSSKLIVCIQCMLGAFRFLVWRIRCGFSLSSGKCCHLEKSARVTLVTSRQYCLYTWSRANSQWNGLSGDFVVKFAYEKDGTRIPRAHDGPGASGRGFRSEIIQLDVKR